MALVWWFIALSMQNTKMTDYKLSEINANQTNYNEKLFAINDENKRNTSQYIGEGITFLLLIIIGAVVVFRAVRRQFQQSQQQQNFMMAITHELKTPIAVTKLNLETLQKHSLPPEKQQQLITSTLQEANRLNTLCNNLLLASQLEAGYQLITEKINLSGLVNECVQDYVQRFPKRILNASVKKDIYFTGDRLMLQMAINNLLDNAVKYSAKEKEINVALQHENAAINLSVSDEGKGIAAGEKEKIFNKFYRAGDVHTRNAKGTGLGLYLTKKIVVQHGGEIVIADKMPEGSIFTILLREAQS